MPATIPEMGAVLTVDEVAALAKYHHRQKRTARLKVRKLVEQGRITPIETTDRMEDWRFATAPVLRYLGVDIDGGDAS